jgi:hypothetical protein
MTVSFWQWWILAGILLLAEILAPGVFFLWVALGAAVAGGLALTVPGLGWEIEGLAMAAVAVATALAGRKIYDPRRVKSDQPFLNRRRAAYVGRVVTLEQPIVDGAGRVKVGGSHWTVTGPDLPAGAKVRVVSVEDSVLRVEAA